MADSDLDADSTTSLLPKSVRLAGVVLVVSAFLPFSPEGVPFWRLALASFESGFIAGLLVTFGFGAPFWLGLAFALCPKLGPDGVSATAWAWRRAAHALCALMHAQLVLVAWSLARAGVGLASWSLFGFAVVSGIYFATSSGRIAAEADQMDGAPPPPRWIARWACSIIVMVAAWLRLQSGQGISLGIALEVGGLAAAFTAWRLSGSRAHR